LHDNDNENNDHQNTDYEFHDYLLSVLPLQEEDIILLQRLNFAEPSGVLG